jgi:hypothetical protein
MEPHKITIETIHKEENAEIRRVMIERFGDSRYLTESNAKAVDFDFDTKGNRRELLRLDWHANMPVMQMLRVVNSTPEPDGSSKTYFLGVPSSIRSVKEGVAWTFGLTTEEYLVTLES